MQRSGGRLVLSATDLTKHLACAHVTTLDLAELDSDDPPVAAGPDDALDLVFRKGIAHEKAYLARLEAAGRQVVRIDGSGVSAAQATAEAMAAGADVIYQATLSEGAWTGKADFLLRRESPEAPSRFGPWAYDIADTKLARRLQVPALLQMASYAQRLAHVQGVEPGRLVVVTGDGQEHPWALSDVRAFARRAASRLESAVARTALLGPDTEPVPVPHCKQCRWSTHCGARWEAADDLGLVAGMRSSHREALRAAGIETLAALAEAPEPAVIDAIGAVPARKLRRQASLQLAERRTGGPVYELVPHHPRLGLDQLPTPHADDVYLDFEGDPWAEGGAGIEYLAGLSDRRGGFFTWWAHDQVAEKRLLEELVDDLSARVAASPGMHVYHYAPYERAALTRLAGRYGTREKEVDDLLRAGVLVDLFSVVRQSLRISKGSYSLKQLEAFYWGGTRSAGEDEVGDALSSVVEYENWLRTGDDDILDSIARYNEQDCRSTLALHEWLEERRVEAVSRGDAVTRPEERVEELDEEAAQDEARRRAELSAQEAEENALAGELREAGLSLAAACVGWHRREARPQWWEFFRYGDLSTDDLVAEPKALGGLGTPEHVRDILDKRGRVSSKVWRYPMPPQEYTGKLRESLPCVDTLKGIGTLVAVDPVQGWAEFSKGAKAEPLITRAAGVKGPVGDDGLRTALRRTGRELLAGSRGGASGALLRAEVPDAATLAPRDGESAADVVVRVGRELDGRVLAVQGPPGTGKTTAASRLIRALLDDGRTVGVTALSHAVISNLLDAVDRPALQKTGSGKDRRMRGEVAETGDAAGIRAALDAGDANLVGGTAWLWSHEDFTEAVDVLVVDEAGQFSLANAMAAARCSRSVVLLGDPQQLTQPTRATHPDGGDVSALAHLIGPHDTIPVERGVFLDRTWRMHPDIARFVSDVSYEGRLAATPGREVQHVEAPGAVSGSGLVWMPVEHSGNVADSPEEAEVVAALVDDLVGGRFTALDGEGRPMALDDVLVVAPFNVHVARLAAALPEGARVGTVDRFQGQEAPVVVYAMGASSADLAPRGVSFLFDLHRLNVAVSRAKALAIVVGSPALLDAAARTPAQVREINAMCRYVESARTVRAPG